MNKLPFKKLRARFYQSILLFHNLNLLHLHPPEFALANLGNHGGASGQ